jgi:hypothetical protein
MEPGKTGLWQDIKDIAKTQRGRQALMSSGAVIAAAGIGCFGPEIFSMMHAGLTFFSASYPFIDPSAMADTLWTGAQYYCAAALDYLGQGLDQIEYISVDMSTQVRDAVNTGREFLSRHGERTFEASRNFVEQITLVAGGYVSDAVQTVGEFAQNGIEFAKEHWQAVALTIGAVKEAFDYFDLGKRIYNKWISRAKKETEKADVKTVNLEVNIAISGVDALSEADRKISDSKTPQPVTINRDDILWISDQLHRSVRQDLSCIDPDTPDETSPSGETRSTPTYGSHTFDVEKVVSKPDLNFNMDDFSHIDLVDDAKTDRCTGNWYESRKSTEFLDRERKTPNTQFNIHGPSGLRRGNSRNTDLEDLHLTGLEAEDNSGRKSDLGPRLM